MEATANETRLTLVYGATGRQGRAVVEQLLKRGHRVRIVVRNAAGGDSLARSGAEIAIGDLSDPPGLRAATQGADAVFLVLPLSIENATTYGRNAVDAASAAGVSHVVFSSGGPMPPSTTDMALVESKRQIEAYLQQSGVPNTILRPALFMENFAAPWSVALIAQQGVVAQPIPRDLPISYIAVDDIGALAAEALARPELAGTAFEIGGPEALCGDDVAERFARALGRPASYHPVPLDQFEDQTNAQMGEPVGTELAKLSRWFSRIGGISLDMGPVLEKLPVQLTTLEEWIRNRVWLPG